MTAEPNTPEGKDVPEKKTPDEKPRSGASDEKDASSSSAPGSESGEQGRPAYVTVLKTLEQQVGEHVVTALQHGGAAAVLTVVQPAPGGGQRIVSVPLEPAAMDAIQTFLDDASDEAEVPCIGFHCFIDRDKGKDKKK